MDSKYSDAKNIFITGHPGIGKTTIIKKLYESLEADKIAAKGFYTQEIKENGQRQGFEIVSLSKRSKEIMAHVSFKTEYQVSKYCVDIKALERLALPELQDTPSDTNIYLIDEIGKMECFSRNFIDATEKVLNNPKALVIGTIAEKGSGYIAKVKQRPDVKIFQVVESNRNALPKQLLDIVKLWKH